MAGGQGDDTLIGGPGDDRLSGGPGNDVFVFGPGDQTDTVTDFSSGTDKVDLTAFEIENIEDVTMMSGDDGVTVDLTDVDGGTILLADITTLPEAGIFWFRASCPAISQIQSIFSLARATMGDHGSAGRFLHRVPLARAESPWWRFLASAAGQSSNTHFFNKKC